MNSVGQKARSLALDRRKQINTLLIFNENVSEVSPNHVYRIDFQAGGQPLVMIIELPPEFPGRQPSVRIEPVGLSHPWLDSSGNVIRAPGLLSYSAHSDLGRVVQAIKRSLERDPPVRYSGVASRQSSNPYTDGKVQLPTPEPSYVHRSNRYQSPTAVGFSYQQQWRPDAAPSPPNPTSPRAVLSELSDLTLADLEELHHDQNALLSFTKTLNNPAMETVDAQFKELRKSVDELVEKNRKCLEETASGVDKLRKRLETKDKLAEELTVLEGKVEDIRSENTLENITSKLKTQCCKDDQESESCADEFLAGKTSLDQFLSDYISSRSKHHVRKAKLDDVTKTNQQLRILQDPSLSHRSRNYNVFETRSLRQGFDGSSWHKH